MSSEKSLTYFKDGQKVGIAIPATKPPPRPGDTVLVPGVVEFVGNLGIVVNIKNYRDDYSRILIPASAIHPAPAKKGESDGQ